jgi:S-formylglutathione hydrolase
MISRNEPKGAGFYLNATKPEFSKYYNMYTHVTLELPQVIEESGIPIVCSYLYDPHQYIAVL